MHHLHHWSGTKFDSTAGTCWHKKNEMIRDAFCICHEATHCQQLSNLRDVTSSTTGRHHVDLKKSTALLLAVSVVQNHSLLSFSRMRCLSMPQQSTHFGIILLILVILLLVGYWDFHLSSGPGCRDRFPQHIESCKSRNWGLQILSL